MNFTVAGCARSCIESFQDCINNASNADKVTCSHHSKPFLVRIEDQLARFSLWVANIRVFGSGRDSLDHRLREASEVHNAVIGLLQALEYRAETCCRILESISSKTDDTTTETLLKELDDVHEGLKNEIALLHKISNTIRRASKDTQNVNAAKTFKIKDDEGNDAEPLLHQLFRNHIRDRFPGTSDNLRQRLADSMLLRRKRILYRGARYGKTSIRAPEAVSKPVISHPKPEPTANMAQTREPVERRVIEPTCQSAVQSTTQTATTLSPENFQRAAANPSVVSISRTVALSSHDELTFPPAPCSGLMRRYNRLKREKEEHHKAVLRSIPGYGGHGKPPPQYAQMVLNVEAKQKEALAKDWNECIEAIVEVTCPFCFYALPVKDAMDEKKWKLHVKNDLDPYVCLFEDCDSAELLYNHSGAWLKHMKEHALRWRCTAKSHGEFVADTRSEYVSHMKTSHPGKFTDAQLGVLADRNARMTGPLFASCPLCGVVEVDGSMEDHIVGHMRFLALKSLPTYQEDTGGLEEQDSESQQDSLATSRPHSRSTIRDDPDRHTLLSFYDFGEHQSRSSYLHVPNQSKYAAWGGFRNYISQFPAGKGLPRRFDPTGAAKCDESSPHEFDFPLLPALYEDNFASSEMHRFDNGSLASFPSPPDPFTALTEPRDPSLEFVDDDLFKDVSQSDRRQFEWGFIPDTHDSTDDMTADPIIRAFLERIRSGFGHQKPVIGMDPDCAICHAPATMACDCEAKGLEVAVKQAEDRMMGSIYQDVRTWVREKSQHFIRSSFDSYLTTLREPELALEQQDSAADTSKIGEPSQQEVNEAWEASVERYPETLEYFFGLAEVTFPAEDEAAVKDPPLSALNGMKRKRGAGDPINDDDLPSPRPGWATFEDPYGPDRTSRAASEGHVDDGPDNEGRSQSGSSRGKPPSRDLTPLRQGSFD
ncbi:hypothetical protein B0T10DRAFT_188142 [Thelonectria olida]|uniref:Uncharacterized protein n=1 Tax=Thelonectria olida TaxID=1576542 RepID=A0A9P8VXI0_9HYPO|nr:hypothetical protein B0T10DRAFT_188142 [Thelonectria olida]